MVYIMFIYINMHICAYIPHVIIQYITCIYIVLMACVYAYRVKFIQCLCT